MMPIIVEQLLKTSKWPQQWAKDSGKLHKILRLLSFEYLGILIPFFAHYREGATILQAPVEQGPRQYIHKMHVPHLASCSCKVSHCCLSYQYYKYI